MPKPAPITAAQLLYDWRSGAAEPPPCCECGSMPPLALCAACLRTICRATDCRHMHASGHGNTWSELPIPK